LNKFNPKGAFFREAERRRKKRRRSVLHESGKAFETRFQA
jgi:hypothetical protein